jgi:murein DD-endopeptidase MepM/ murein hydrolase activator NlpD
MTTNIQLVNDIKGKIGNYDSQQNLKKIIYKTIYNVLFKTVAKAGTSVNVGAITVSGDTVSLDSDKLANFLLRVSSDTKSSGSKLGTSDIVYSTLLNICDHEGIFNVIVKEQPLIDDVEGGGFTERSKKSFIALFKDLAILEGGITKDEISKFDEMFNIAAPYLIEFGIISKSAASFFDTYYPLVDISFLNSKDSKFKSQPKATKIIKEVVDYNKKNQTNKVVLKIGTEFITFNEYLIECSKPSKISLELGSPLSKRARVVLENPGKKLKVGLQGGEDQTFVDFTGIESFKSAIESTSDAGVEAGAASSQITSVKYRKKDDHYILSDGTTGFPPDVKGLVEICATPGAEPPLIINWLVDPFMNIVYAGNMKKDEGSTWEEARLRKWHQYSGRSGDKSRDIHQWMSILIISKIVKEFSFKQWASYFDADGENVNNNQSISQTGMYVNTNKFNGWKTDASWKKILGFAKEINKSGGDKGSSLISIAKKIIAASSAEEAVNIVLLRENKIKSLSSIVHKHLITAINMCKVSKFLREGDIESANTIISNDPGLSYEDFSPLLTDYYNSQTSVNESVFKIGNRVIYENKIKEIIKRTLLKEAADYENKDEVIKELEGLKDKSDNALADYWTNLAVNRVKVRGVFNEYTGRDSIKTIKNNEPFVDAYKSDFIPAMKEKAEAAKQALEDSKDEDEKGQSEETVAGKERTESEETTTRQKSSSKGIFSSAPVDMGEKQFEIDRGYVGTFLRASQVITSLESEVVSQADVGVKQEARVRSAIRSVLKEATLGQKINAYKKAIMDTAKTADESFKLKAKLDRLEAQNIDLEGQVEYLETMGLERQINMYELEDELESTSLRLTQAELESSGRLKEIDKLNAVLKEYTTPEDLSEEETNEIISVLKSPGYLGGTKWAVFSTFEDPDLPYYAICMHDQNQGYFEGAGFTRSDFPHVGKTNTDAIGKLMMLGKVEDNQDSIIEFAIERIIFDAMETFDKSLNIKEWNTKPGAISETAITYAEFGKLFKEGNFKDQRFENSMRTISNYLTDKSKLYNLAFIETDMLGVMRDDNGLVDNLRSDRPKEYKSMIAEFNKAMSGELRPGEKVSFELVRTGRSKDPKFKSDNSRHEDLLNKKSAQLKNIKSYLSAAGSKTSRSLGRVEKTNDESVRDKVAIPGLYLDYVKGLPSLDRIKPSDHYLVGNETFYNNETKTLQILPKLNEKQFYAILINYYTDLGTEAGARSVSRSILKTFKESYQKYSKEYENNTTREVMNSLKKQEEINTFNQERKNIARNYNKSSGFKYLKSKPSKISIGMAKNLKRRERNAAEGAGRRESLVYIHAPGPSGNLDPYEDFIKILINSCSGGKSASMNPSYTKGAKIFESLVNRHETLYNIYLNNKIKERVKKRILVAEAKKKIKSKLLEKYKPGSVALTSLRPVKSKTTQSGKEEPDTGQPGNAEGVASGDSTTSNVNGDKESTPDAPIQIIADESSGFPTVGKKVTSPASVARRITYKKDFPPHEHSGADFAAELGDPVYAILGGEILDIIVSSTGYGNTVKIKHSDTGEISSYSHLSGFVNTKTQELTTTRGETFKKGDKIVKGQLIGFAGETGAANGVHVHFGIYKEGQASTYEKTRYAIGWLIEHENDLKINKNAEWNAVKEWYNLNLGREQAPVTGNCIIDSVQTNPLLTDWGPDKYWVAIEDTNNTTTFRNQTINVVKKVVYKTQAEIDADNQATQSQNNQSVQISGTKIFSGEFGGYNQNVDDEFSFYLELTDDAKAAFQDVSSIINLNAVFEEYSPPGDGSTYAKLQFEIDASDLADKFSEYTEIPNARPNGKKVWFRVDEDGALRILIERTDANLSPKYNSDEHDLLVGFDGDGDLSITIKPYYP